jgi:hypothetical protein
MQRTGQILQASSCTRLDGSFICKGLSVPCLLQYFLCLNRGFHTLADIPFGLGLQLYKMTHPLSTASEQIGLWPAITTPIFQSDRIDRVS